MQPIQMVDLKRQYERLRPDIDEAIQGVISSTQFIKGPVVADFERNLGQYLGVDHVIGCANGTDALQIALMALELDKGAEVICPAFTYAATAEVICLLGLKPVMVDVDPLTFNTSLEYIKNAITPKTAAVIPVHLFGQACEMGALIEFCDKQGLAIVEDNAQAIGSTYQLPDGTRKKAGTLGHIGCTSFFPSKNLGCYGDGGAIFTSDQVLADKIRKIANHGQSVRYYHDEIGVNSRLDAIQAAVLTVKLKQLDDFNAARVKVADFYDAALGQIDEVQIPVRAAFSDHVFHQYTLRVKPRLRAGLIDYLTQVGVPNGLYYPLPLYKQKAYESHFDGKALVNTEQLCQSVISLPIHTEMTDEILEYITSKVISYFKQEK